MENKPYCIGICFSHAKDSSDIQLLHTLCHDIKNAGMCTLSFQFLSDLSVGNDSDIGEMALIQLIPYHQLDAMLILTETIKCDDAIQQVVDECKNANVPVIAIDRPWEGCHHICYDTHTAFRYVIDHIITVHHCSRIAFLAGIRGNAISEERLQIYRESLEAHGIPYDETLVKWGEFWYGPTEKAVQEILWEQKGDRFPQAFCCSNDAMAMAVCAELSKVGIRVPQDVLVTGCDGTYAEQFFNPRLTTAAIRYSGIGAAVVKLLKRLCRCPAPNRCCTETVPYRPRIGQSCGCKHLDASDAGTRTVNIFLSLEGYRFFHQQMHDIMSRMLAENITKEELPIRLLKSRFGLPWYWCSLVLTRDTYLALGYTPDEEDAQHETVEFCRWAHGEELPLMKPFSSDFLVENPEEVFEAAESNALMVTVLHEQAQILGYFVMAYEPATPEYNENALEYSRLADYQSSIAHVLFTLIQRQALLEMNKQLEEMYIHDSMTGLYNRRGFYQQFYTLRNENDFWLCIAVVDMDSLKHINDTYGHAEGDIAILGLADILKSISPRHSIAARFGGDEFCLAMMLERDNIHFPEAFRRRMEEEIEIFNEHCQLGYSISASCGIEMQVYHKNIDLDAVMKLADDKMYIEKSMRKNQHFLRKK